MSYSSTPSHGAPAVLPTSSTWPLVVGIVTIVFGILGMLGGCFGTLMTFAMDFMRDVMPEGQTATLDAMANHKAMFAALAIGGLILGALLLVGGILTMRRRRLAYGILFTWLVLKIAYVVGKVPFDLMVGREQMDAMQEQSAGSGQPVSLGAAGDVLMMLGAVMNLLWGLALPLFLLVWLLRRPIRREMASW